MVLAEFLIVKSAIAWAISAKTVASSARKADVTFSDLRRKTFLVESCIEPLLSTTFAPEAVLLQAQWASTILTEMDAILVAEPTFSSVTHIPRKISESGRLTALDKDLDIALKKLLEECESSNTPVDSAIALAFSPEDLKPLRLDSTEEIAKEVEESKQGQIPKLLKGYIPTWESIGFRCRLNGPDGPNGDHKSRVIFNQDADQLPSSSHQMVPVALTGAN